MKYQSNDSCLVCGKTPTDLDHIKTRGAGGVDESWNLWPLCRPHHIERHKKGIITFVRRYPILDIELKIKGWEFINGKLVHPKMNDRISHYQKS